VADSSTTLNASGKQAAPTTGLAIATLTTPAAGTYAVRVYIGLAGTLTATTDANNVELLAGATVIGTIGNPGTAGEWGPFPFDVTMDGASNLTVNAIGAATASSEYSATIIAEPLGTGKLVSL
jgi:hypothetical protein